MSITSRPVTQMRAIPAACEPTARRIETMSPRGRAAGTRAGGRRSSDRELHSRKAGVPGAYAAPRRRRSVSRDAGRSAWTAAKQRLAGKALRAGASSRIDALPVAGHQRGRRADGESPASARSAAIRSGSSSASRARHAVSSIVERARAEQPAAAARDSERERRMDPENLGRRRRRASTARSRRRARAARGAPRTLRGRSPSGGAP